MAEGLAKGIAHDYAARDYGPGDPVHGDTVEIAGEPGRAVYRVAASDPVRRAAVVVAPDGTAHRLPWSALRVVSRR